MTGSLVAGRLLRPGPQPAPPSTSPTALTWLSDDPTGEIIQVNPATGELEVSRSVGNPGDDLEVLGEYGGQLYVTDHTSGPAARPST